MGTFRKAALAAVVGALLLVPGARAAITGSNITTPGDPSFFIADRDAASQAFTVAGTTSGGNPATDKVDIRCYFGTTSLVAASNVALNGDGSFSTPTANLLPVRDRMCRLRAVPAGSSPADLSPFGGPRVGIGERQTAKVGSGTNAGVAFDYYIYGQQVTGAWDYSSLGDWGVEDGYLFDSTFAQTTNTFWGNAGFFRTEATPPTRSELQVDGADAYAPDQADVINAVATGLPAVTYSYSLDAASGNLVITESDPIVKCPTATYPPTPASCPSFVSTGVTDHRTIVQDNDGHLSTTADSFTSTDGGAHSLDLLWHNYQKFHGSTGDAAQIEYQFPGQSGFSVHAVGDTVVLPATPGTILVRYHGAPDGDQSKGQGAIVYDRPADVAKFEFSNANDEEFYLHQTGTVPAGGSTTYRFAYAQAYGSGDVAALAQAATDRLGSPSVTISSPANGTVVHAPSVAVGGVAVDNVAVTSLTVNGAAVPVGAGGAWSANVPLQAGANAITAVARDGAGNSAQAAITVTYQPVNPPPPPPPAVKCKVPKLKNKKLSAAKKALKKAHCGVGKVKKAKSRKIKKGRIISSSPKAGKVVAKGTKVKLTESRGRH